MSEELKTCPFCGGEAELKRHDDTFSVICEHHEWSKLNADGIRTAGDIAIYADMQGEYNFDTHELEYSPEEIERCKNAVIEAWNTRAERTCKATYPNDSDYRTVPIPRCSECRRPIIEYEDGGLANYCHYCGAKVIRQ